MAKSNKIFVPLYPRRITLQTKLKLKLGPRRRSSAISFGVFNSVAEFILNDFNAPRSTERNCGAVRIFVWISKSHER